MLGPASLSTPTYAPTWRLGFYSWKMPIPKSSLNSKRVSKKRCSLPWGSLRIMCLPHTRIEKSRIPCFFGLSEVFFTSHLFSLFFPFYQFCFRFIMCLCDPFQGTWPMRGNLFSLVLACSSDLDRGPCSF